MWKLCTHALCGILVAPPPTECFKSSFCLMLFLYRQVFASGTLPFCPCVHMVLVRLGRSYPHSLACNGMQLSQRDGHFSPTEHSERQYGITFTAYSTEENMLFKYNLYLQKSTCTLTNYTQKSVQ